MTSWRESASRLLSLFDSQDVDRDDREVERACAAALLQLPVVDGDDDDVDEVRRIIETTRLRSLIRIGRFDAVIAAGRDDEDGLNKMTLEVAYALFRSGNYEACRRLCAASRTGGGDCVDDDHDDDPGGRGLMHVHAQALYRLGETDAADDIYRELLLPRDRSGGSSHRATDAVDADEREDALSNALANRIANHTPGIIAVNTAPSSSDRGWLEEDPDLRRLLEIYGRTGPNDDDVDDENGKTSPVAMHNYDLAYNLATYLLVSRSSRPRSAIVEAMNLLMRAEKSATSTIEDGDVDVFDPMLAERESNPIRANLAMSKMILGGTSNETEAYRDYLTLLARLGGDKKGRRSGGGANNNIALAEGNLLAAISNNIACLRDGKESLSDSLRRVPTAGPPRMSPGSEDLSPGVGGVVGSSTPLVGATPHQARFALYNRALVLARMGNVRGCREALVVLRSSLRVSYHGDESERKRLGSPSRSAVGESPEMSDAGGVKKRKKKSKNGQNHPAIGSVANSIEGTIVSVEENDVLAARPGSDVESIAWDARADLLESELRRISESSLSSSNYVLDAAISKIDAVMASSSSNDFGGVLPYTKSLLLLHRGAVNDPSSQRRSKAAILESLPSSVRACPGAIVTMASLHDDADMAESALSSLGGDRRANLAVAEFRVERKQYEAAVDLLRDIVEKNMENDGNDEVFDKMEAMAILVTALSYIDPSNAEKYASLLPVRSSELSGEALEFMDIPRFAKQASLEGGMAGGASKVRKLIATTSGKGKSNMGEQKKKSRDRILRKRSKQRKAYLSHLESEGRALSKPDPERWIPKCQRSYNNRRGKFRSNVGAQGGGAGPGMEKVAAKLDVAARVAAAKSGSGGSDGGSGKQPSTANIKVSSTVTRKGKGGKKRR